MTDNPKIFLSKRRKKKKKENLPGTILFWFNWAEEF